MKKRVVIFGIFDGVHEGHRDFFQQAREYGDELIAVVGRDDSALRLKNKKPKHSESERLEFVAQEQLVDEAVLGDKEQSSYDVLAKLNSDVICLGYDQEELDRDLTKWMENREKKIPMYRLQPYKEHELHSSLFDKHGLK